MSFGENLKRIRKEAGLNQEELARVIRMSPSTLSRYESELGYPDAKTIEQICQSLECGPEDLFKTEVVGKEWSNHASACAEMITQFKPHIQILIKRMIRGYQKEQIAADQWNADQVEFGTSEKEDLTIK